MEFEFHRCNMRTGLKVTNMKEDELPGSVIGDGTFECGGGFPGF